MKIDLLTGRSSAGVFEAACTVSRSWSKMCASVSKTLGISELTAVEYEDKGQDADYRRLMGFAW